MRWLLILGLASCSTPHQTRDLAPFFRTDPNGYLASSYLYEQKTLESEPTLNVWQNKRLQSLYEVELAQLGKETLRYSELSLAQRKLMETTRPLAEKVEQARKGLSGPVTAPEAAAAVFQDAEFKKVYFEAYRLWNRDENEAALQKLSDEIRQGPFQALSTPERIKAYDLLFRIALDVQNFSLAQNTYALMHQTQSCGRSTADAGFVLALHLFGVGNYDRAWEVWQQQCDPDDSPAEKMKQLYWKARFAQARGQPADAFEPILHQAVPSYYYILAQAQAQKGQALTAASLDSRSYRSEPISVPYSVDEWWTSAEQSLAFGLRSDASVFLSRAAARLRPGAGRAEIPALLYTAHLFQAAGSQLEAMQLYAQVSEIAQSQRDPVAFDFLTEMFPRPFATEVSTVAHQWQLDADFLYAIMRQESAFNPNAVSNANARGLMQLMPFLGEQIAKQWAFEPYYSSRTLFFARENLKLAGFHIKQLQAQLPHPALMAAAYNAGVKRAAAWWKRLSQYPLDAFVELIPIGETRNYVKLVLRNYIYYKVLRGQGTLDLSVLPLTLPEPKDLLVGYSPGQPMYISTHSLH